jgi:hypothetical protein
MIANAVTGKVLERDRTPEEQAQHEADKASAAAAAAEADAVVAQREALRASAEKKLAKLGLTVDEIAAITP